MTKAYRILAYLIAAEVVIQAAVITLASFGFSKWIDNGGVADLASFRVAISASSAISGTNCTARMAPCTSRFCPLRSSFCPSSQGRSAAA